MSTLSPFAGVVGPTVDESTPDWPEPRRRNGAPNVVVVVFDDTGWSDFGCFGSEIATPTLDRLAVGGTKLTNFHVTPLCSPTRACLLTGRNHHSVGMRFLAVADTGFPNARARLPVGVPTLPGLLREQGYGTYLSGKWHLAPQEELTPAGPFGNWPLARGFDRFYGFLSGANDEFAPELISDNSPAAHVGGEEYHLSADLVDHAIGFLSDHVVFRPDDPFFLQLAFGATHAPFQAPEQYLNRYRGVFDAGWEASRAARLERQLALGIIPRGTELTEHDADVPRWGELNDEERSRAAACQEAYAAYLEHADAELGRLVSFLEQQELLDETLIVAFSDNGAAGDGGRTGAASVIALYNDLGHDRSASAIPISEIGSRTGPAHYATGWAMASNTPFRLYKQYVDLGGVRSPCIVRWPRLSAAKPVSSDFAHVIDLAPTILEAAGCLDTESGQAMHGRSLRPALTGKPAGEPRTQYFEMLGHRGIWHDGWKAVTRHRPGTPFDEDCWRLYDTRDDFAECHDLADKEPELLASLQQRWHEEAERFDVYPLDDRSLKQMLMMRDPRKARWRRSWRLLATQSHLSFTSGICGSARPVRITLRLAGRREGDEGVLLASGTCYGGYVLYVLDGKLVFEHVLIGERVSCSAPDRLPLGDVDLAIEFRSAAPPGGTVVLEVAGRRVATQHLPAVARQPAFYGIDVGRDRVSQISTAYADRGEFPYRSDGIVDVTLEFLDLEGDVADVTEQLERTQ